MNFEKLEALVSVMSNDQYLKFETAVLNLLNENSLFSKSEMILLEKKVQNRRHLERESVLVANN